MTVTAKPIVTSKYAASSQTTEYTASGLRTIIDKFTGTNVTAGAVTLAINLVPLSVAASAENLIVTKSLSAGETYTFPELVGHVLEAGGFISCVAGAGSSIVIRVSGREVN